MNIDVKIVSKDEFPERILYFIQKLLGIPENLAREIYNDQLNLHIDQLKDKMSIVIEYPYVDKVYRNSYYNYFSSKLDEYSRYCIRLSFFNVAVNDEHFQGEIDTEFLQNNFWGFMILRPTILNIVGRSIISPDALNSHDFISCKAEFPTSVNSLKLNIGGFPYSSQDSETISCAETTLWATMEYFSQKYAEYGPVLPSKIIEVLRKVSTERQLPSKGLNVDQISYALREFGFGTKPYSLDNYEALEFRRLFSCYVESGLPIIVLVDNYRHKGSTGHAIVCVGHNIVTNDKLDFLEESEIEETKIEIQTKTIDGCETIKEKLKIVKTKYTDYYKAGNITFFDNDDIEKKFVFIDDNRPVYQQMPFSNPVAGYLDTRFEKCEITHFIVPLYPKIYLEAYEAKKFCRWFIFKYLDFPDGSDIYLRFFLASSRSYKNKLKLNKTFSEEVRQLILEKPMPKFIWVGELSTKELIIEKLANGLVILDATEPNTSFLKPLLISAYSNDLISIDSTTHKISKKDILLQNFSIFTNNLK